jgi:hypothetical protein
MNEASSRATAEEFAHRIAVDVASLLRALVKHRFIARPGWCTLECNLNSAEITPLKNITFPTNGQLQFGVTVPAIMSGPLSGQVGNRPFNVQTSPGTLSLNFYLPNPDQPFIYLFDGATFSTSVPEPAPFGLMAAGLVGLVGVVLRRRKLAGA